MLFVCIPELVTFFSSVRDEINTSLKDVTVTKDFASRIHGYICAWNLYLMSRTNQGIEVRRWFLQASVLYILDAQEALVLYSPGPSQLFSTKGDYKKKKAA